MLEGLPPNNAATVLRFTCDEGLARRAADIVMEFIDPAQIAAAAFEDTTSDARPRNWIVEVYLAPPVDIDQVRTVLASSVGWNLAATAVAESLVEQDWVETALAGLAPVRAGRFLIHGRHGRAKTRSNDFSLEIEAALAFGTGHHGTTRGCLLALEQVIKRERPRRVLDIGTGTGVLAMAAAKALKRPIAAGDLDPIAVRAAGANAVLNGVGALVRPVVSRGLTHPALRAAAPYDLVLANILAAPLKAMAREIAGRTSPGAGLIVSGLLPADVPGILCRYGTVGFALQRRLELEGWATLVLRRRYQARQERQSS